MRGFLYWLAEEWRLMRTENWGAGVYDNRRTPEVFEPPLLTREDPRCKAVELRQRLMRQKLRQRGIAPRVGVGCNWDHDERAFRFVRRTS